MEQTDNQQAEMDAPPEQLTTTVAEDGALEVRGYAGDAGTEVAASDQVEPQAPEVPGYVNELQSRLAGLEGTLRSLGGMLGANRQQSEAPQPPKSVDQLETVQDLMEHIDWKMNQSNQSAQGADMRVRATLAEERARGTLSASALGAGNDYDSVVNKYVVPLMQNNPAMTQLFHTQADPALAAYTFGLMQEIAERHGGDPVKAFQAIRSAMSAEMKGQQNLKKNIEQATKTAATKIFNQPTRQPGGTKRLDKEAIWGMSDAEFKDFASGVGA